MTTDLANKFLICRVLCVDTNQLENTSVLLADFQKLLCERYILNVFKAKQIKAEVSVLSLQFSDLAEQRAKINL